MVNPDGTGLVKRNIDSPHIFHPDWAPDGRRILVTLDKRFEERGNALGVVNQNGSVSELHRGLGEGSARWSPDGIASSSPDQGWLSRHFCYECRRYWSD